MAKRSAGHGTGRSAVLAGVDGLASSLAAVSSRLRHLPVMGNSLSVTVVTLADAGMRVVLAVAVGSPLAPVVAKLCNHCTICDGLAAGLADGIAGLAGLGAGRRGALTGGEAALVVVRIKRFQLFAFAELHSLVVTDLRYGLELLVTVIALPVSIVALGLAGAVGLFMAGQLRAIAAGVAADDVFAFDLNFNLIFGIISLVNRVPASRSAASIGDNESRYTVLLIRERHDLRFLRNDTVGKHRYNLVEVITSGIRCHCIHNGHLGALLKGTKVPSQQVIEVRSLICVRCEVIARRPLDLRRIRRTIRFLGKQTHPIRQFIVNVEALEITFAPVLNRNRIGISGRTRLTVNLLN